MSVLGCVSLLLALGTLTQGIGVTRWCEHPNKFLYSYVNGNYAYSSLDTAKAECLKRSDCFGVTKQRWSYTLRKGWELHNSPSGEISYVPCEGYFNCDSFGLRSVHGKYLSAQPNGKVEWNRDHYRSWETITFEQYGKDSVFLKSVHGKYLAATNKRRLEWNRGHRLSWEKFRVFQYEDKIALMSYHGRYLSAQPDGSVDVDRTAKLSWEWFTVHPQECLANIQCDCSKEINKNDYEMAGVEYKIENGMVEAYPPEQVGYQHIDNKDSTSSQSTKFSVSEAVTETSSFSHTAGASVTVGTTFSTGVPFIAKGEISVEVTASYEHTWGKETSVTKTVQAEYNCIANPGKIVTCRALLLKYYMTVPYIQQWKHKRLPCSCTTEGVFNDISANEMQLEVDEV